MNPLAKIAVTLILASALIHLAIPILSGFVYTSQPPLFYAALLIGLGLIMLRNRRWVMWLSFFCCAVWWYRRHGGVFESGC